MNSDTINALNCYRRMGYEDVSEDFADEINSIPDAAGKQEFVKSATEERPVLVYLFLVVGLRLAGKRELAQLNPFDLVVLLTLSNTVQNAIIGDDSTVLGGIIGATTLLVLNYMVVRFLSRHERLDRLVEGAADPLVENGHAQIPGRHPSGAVTRFRSYA